MLIQLLLAIVGAVLLHLLAMAACAQAFGITVRHISIGIGPQVLSLGRLRFGLIPAGGHVRLAMLADAPAGTPVAGALDDAARWKRMLLPLSGPLALLGLGLLLLGMPAIGQFIRAFPQLIDGAFSPLGKAQGLLRDAGDVLGRLAGLQVLGLVACKLAAFNLLPFLGSNGLAAVTGWLPREPRNGRAAARLLTGVALAFTLLLLVSWPLALAVFLWSRQ